MPEIAPWITYRPELKVLDCTIRDGGLINNHQFGEGLVRGLRNMRRGRRRLHGSGLQGFREATFAR